MNIGLRIILTILPTILLWKYINGLDRNKEPIGVLRKLFFGGFLSILITLSISIFLYVIFEDFFEYEVTFSLTGFLYSILGIGLVEELSKFLMVYALGWHEKNLDETYDVILYSMFVALGFATAENILYSFTSGIAASIFRIFTAVPGHVIDGSFMGYFLCKYRIKGNKGDLILAILVPSLTHGVYDFIVFSIETVLGLIIFAIFVIGEFIIAKRLVNKMALNSRFLPLKTVRCKNCGKIINTRFCPDCGKERD